jgi:hypothetical protein
MAKKCRRTTGVRSAGGKDPGCSSEDHGDPKLFPRCISEDHGDPILVSIRNTGDHGDPILVSIRNTGDHGDPILVSIRSTGDHGDPILIPRCISEDHGDPKLFPRCISEDHGDPKLIPGCISEDHGDPKLIPGCIAAVAGSTHKFLNFTAGIRAVHGGVGGFSHNRPAAPVDVPTIGRKKTRLTSGAASAGVLHYIRFDEFHQLPLQILDVTAEGFRFGQVEGGH